MEISQMIEEINCTYEEWLEMGHPLEDLLLALLYRERLRTEDLTYKLERLRKENTNI